MLKTRMMYPMREKVIQSSNMMKGGRLKSAQLKATWTEPTAWLRSRMKKVATPFTTKQIIASVRKVHARPMLSITADGISC
ncbi:hypothetical protein RRF57_010473 [Xylaria bambusicola]|uniref:Uncharacterized protein n=1 Tax=Xylaria bambusicola TaxID=326684 RepID=A0AAN7ZCM7_9PEZI